MASQYDNLGFPSDVLKFMKQNANPKMAIKLMQISKYFQHQKFPFVVFKSFWIQSLANGEENWDGIGFSDKKSSPKQMEEMPNKIWVIHQLKLSQRNLSIFSRIVYCEIEEFHIGGPQNMSLKEFKFLVAAGNVRLLKLENNLIIHDGIDEEIVSLEALVECLPKLETLIRFCTSDYEITPTFVENYITPQMRIFSVNSRFMNFPVRAINQAFSLTPWESITAECIAELQDFTDILIQNWRFHQLPFFISFPGQSQKSKNGIAEIRKTFFNRLKK